MGNGIHGVTKRGRLRLPMSFYFVCFCFERTGDQRLRASGSCIDQRKEATPPTPGTATGGRRVHKGGVWEVCRGVSRHMDCVTAYELHNGRQRHAVREVRARTRTGHWEAQEQSVKGQRQAHSSSNFQHQQALGLTPRTAMAGGRGQGQLLALPSRRLTFFRAGWSRSFLLPWR